MVIDDFNATGSPNLASLVQTYIGHLLAVLFFRLIYSTCPYGQEIIMSAFRISGFSFASTDTFTDATIATPNYATDILTIGTEPVPMSDRANIAEAIRFLVSQPAGSFVVTQVVTAGGEILRYLPATEEVQLATQGVFSKAKALAFADGQEAFLPVLPAVVS